MNPDPNSKTSLLGLAVRWLWPTAVLFLVLAALAWKIAQTKNVPFVYDF